MKAITLDDAEQALVKALRDSYTHKTLSSTAAALGCGPKALRARMRRLLVRANPATKLWRIADWKRERWEIFTALGITEDVKDEWRRRKLV